MYKSAFIALFIFLSLAAPFFAAADYWSDLAQGLVPLCGGVSVATQEEDEGVTNTTRTYTPCDTCHLAKMITGALARLWYPFAVVIAALMLTYGGFLMIIPSFGGSAAMYEKGKKTLLNTFIGLAIVFFAWLAIDTIIKVFAQQSILDNNQQPGVLFEKYTETPTDYYFPWNQIKCTEIGPIVTNIERPAPVKSPTEEQCKDGSEEVDGIQICDNGFTRDYVDNSITNAEGESLKSGGVGAACAPGTLAKLGTSIDGFFDQAAAESGVNKSLLQAIMITESEGNIRAIHNDRDFKSSYGLMQVRLDTLRSLSSTFPELKGSSDLQLTEWLYNPRNNIRAGAAYAKTLQNKYPDQQKMLAAYNGGPVANYPSVNCPGVTRWQCPWDSNGCWGTSRTDCVSNTAREGGGYGTTRSYVPKVQGLQSQIQADGC